MYRGMEGIIITLIIILSLSQPFYLSVYAALHPSPPCRTRGWPTDLEVERQAAPQGSVMGWEAVREQHPVHDAEQQLLGSGGCQQGAPVLHHAAWITWGGGKAFWFASCSLVPFYPATP